MRLRSVEAMRGLAAVSVMLGHATSTAIADPAIGGSRAGNAIFLAITGVQFFFVLSGFVMALSHAADLGHARAIPGFVWARLCRIYPMLWLATGLLWLEYSGWASFPAAMWVNGALLNPADNANLLPVIWTLKLELAFYGLLALGMLPGAGRWVLLAFAGFTPAVLLAGLAWPGFEAWLSSDPFSFQFLVFSPEFCVGFAAGMLFRRRAPSLRVGCLLVGAGLVAVAARIMIDQGGESYGPTYSHYIYGAGIAAVLVGAAAIERAGRSRLGRWAAWLGAASYPLYLLHLIILDTLRRTVGFTAIGPLRAGDAFLLAGIAATLAASVAVGLLIDQPLQRLLRRAARPGRQLPLPSPGD